MNDRDRLDWHVYVALYSQALCSKFQVVLARCFKRRRIVRITLTEYIIAGMEADEESVTVVKEDEFEFYNDWGEGWKKWINRYSDSLLSRLLRMPCK